MKEGRYPTVRRRYMMETHAGQGGRCDGHFLIPIPVPVVLPNFKLPLGRDEFQYQGGKLTAESKDK